MGRISDEDVERVRDATDCVSLISQTVVLKKKGRLYWGNCPFHAEKTPSFKVDPTSGLWHCFGCGAGGDAIGFVMKAENLEFPEAVRLLADRARIEIREETGGVPTGLKERVLGGSEEAAGFYHRLLTTSTDASAKEARAYLKSRHMGSGVAQRFRLGYAPAAGSPLTAYLTSRGFTADELVSAGLATRDDRGRVRDRFFNRVMFPISDLSGRVIAFGGRVLGEGRPKYLNSAETPVFHKSATMYALDRAKNEIVSKGVAVVVEGYTDVIALHEAGFGHAVATLGTALTEQHVRLLARFAKRVVYLFDGDDAGVRAARRAEEFLDWQATPESSAGKLDLQVAIIPGGKDPADLVASEGAEALQALIDRAVPLLRFALDARLGDADLDSPEARAAALRSCADVLARVRDSLLVHDYANFVADRLRVEYATVQQAVLDAARRRRQRPAAVMAAPEPRAAAPTGGPRTAQDRAESELLQVLARSPHLRAEARELLAFDAVADAGRHRLLEVVIDAGDATGRALYEAVVARVPQAAETASSWELEEGRPEEDEGFFRELVARLKEFSLKRQIIGLQTLMEALDPVRDRAAYDDAFRTTASLQRELEAVRRAAGRQDQDTEA